MKTKSPKLNTDTARKTRRVFKMLLKARKVFIERDSRRRRSNIKTPAITSAKFKGRLA